MYPTYMPEASTSGVFEEALSTDHHNARIASDPLDLSGSLVFPGRASRPVTSLAGGNLKHDDIATDPKDGFIREPSLYPNPRRQAPDGMAYQCPSRGCSRLFQHVAHYAKHLERNHPDFGQRNPDHTAEMSLKPTARQNSFRNVHPSTPQTHRRQTEDRHTLGRESDVVSVVPSSINSLQSSRSSRSVAASSISADPGIDISLDRWSDFQKESILSLDAVSKNWSTEEFRAGRKLVKYRPTRRNGLIALTSETVPGGEWRPTNDTVSCIFWAERVTLFATRDDLVRMAESMLETRLVFGVRQGLYGLLRSQSIPLLRNLMHHLTRDQGNETFYKVVIDFVRPKPYELHKDFVVVEWSFITQVLDYLIQACSSSNSNSSPGMATAHTRNTNKMSSLANSYTNLTQNFVKPRAGAVMLSDLDIRYESFDETSAILTTGQETSDSEVQKPQLQVCRDQPSQNQSRNDISLSPQSELKGAASSWISRRQGACDKCQTLKIKCDGKTPCGACVAGRYTRHWCINSERVTNNREGLAETHLRPGREQQSHDMTNVTFVDPFAQEQRFPTSSVSSPHHPDKHRDRAEGDWIASEDREVEISSANSHPRACLSDRTQGNCGQSQLMPTLGLRLGQTATEAMPSLQNPEQRSNSSQQHSDASLSDFSGESTDQDVAFADNIWIAARALIYLFVAALRRMATHDSTNSKQNPGATHTVERAAAPQACSSNSSRMYRAKRKPGENDGDDQDQAKRQKHTQPSNSVIVPQLLACPFHKFNSYLFGPDSPEPSYHVCGASKFNNSAYLKQHLQRNHCAPKLYCPCCFLSDFDSQAAFNAHMRARPPCELRDPPLYLERIHIDLAERLRLGRKNETGVDRVVYWYEVFDALFPGTREDRQICRFYEGPAREYLNAFIAFSTPLVDGVLDVMASRQEVDELAPEETTRPSINLRESVLQQAMTLFDSHLADLAWPRLADNHPQLPTPPQSQTGALSSYTNRPSHSSQTNPAWLEMSTGCSSKNGSQNTVMSTDAEASLPTLFNPLSEPEVGNAFDQFLQDPQGSLLIMDNNFSRQDFGAAIDLAKTQEDMLEPASGPLQACLTGFDPQWSSFDTEWALK